MSTNAKKMTNSARSITKEPAAILRTAKVMNASVQKAMKAILIIALRSLVQKVEYGKIECALMLTNVSSLPESAMSTRILLVRITTEAITVLVVTTL